MSTPENERQLVLAVETIKRDRNLSARDASKICHVSLSWWGAEKRGQEIVLYDERNKERT